MAVSSEFPLQIHNIGKRHICFIAQSQGNQKNEPKLSTLIELRTPKLCRKLRIIQEFPFYKEEENGREKKRGYERDHATTKAKARAYMSSKPRIFNSLFNRLCCSAKATDFSEVTIESIRRKSKAFPMLFKKIHDWEKKKPSELSSFDDTSTLGEPNVKRIDLDKLEERMNYKDSIQTNNAKQQKSDDRRNMRIDVNPNHIPPELAKPLIILESSFNSVIESN